MDSDRRAIILANLHRKGLLKGHELQEGSVSYELGSNVKISVANIGDKRFGKKGIYEYDTTLQTCHELPDGYVAIEAPYGKLVHYYACQYDPEIDGHLPIYFLARSAKL